MLTGVDSHSSHSDRFEQKRPMVLKDVISVTPQVLLSDESAGKSNSHLLGERAGIVVVGEYVRGRRVE